MQLSPWTFHLWDRWNFKPGYPPLLILLVILILLLVLLGKMLASQILTYSRWTGSGINQLSKGWLSLCEMSSKIWVYIMRRGRMLSWKVSFKVRACYKKGSEWDTVIVLYEILYHFKRQREGFSSGLELASFLFFPYTSFCCFICCFLSL